MLYDLKKIYKDEIVKKMKKKYNYKNLMEVPKFKKVVINRGLGEAIDNAKALEVSINELTKISGQKVVSTKAKKSIAGFKLREGQKIGVKVTLRGKKMYDFLNKFINICLPKIRDFKGVRASFDGNGNYTFGIMEQIIFPEISYEKTDKIRGVNVTVVTSARTDDEAKELLSLIGVPFRN